MLSIAAEAARTHQFDEKTLRLTLAETPIVITPTVPPSTEPLRRAGSRACDHSIADGILTQQEESLLRDFRNRLAFDEAQDRYEDH